MDAKALPNAFTVTARIVALFVAAGFTGFTACEAQSLVGKWHRGGTTLFVLDKATGAQRPLSAPQQKQFDDMALANGYTETLEFKPDHTYVSHVSAKGRAPQAKTEHYTLSGKALDLNLPPVQGEKPTITVKSLNANSMVWDFVLRGKLTEVVYTRMP